MEKPSFCRVWTKEGYQDFTDGEWFNFDINKLHRLDGPAIEWPDGTKRWYLDGKIHRLDGPAYEGADGIKAWYVDGNFHRLDGPAIEHVDGTKEWWVDGKYLPKKEVDTWIEENKIDLKTQEGQIAFKLRWS